MAQAQEVVYLKLGGSLITDKRRTECPRPTVIARLAREIAAARRARPSMQLVIGHGSGSFGHVTASRYGTRAGVETPEQWYGFAATGDAAARLNRIVTAALLDAGLPAWSIQPGVALRGIDGALRDGPHATVAAALARELIPVIYGDVMLDDVRGGSIAGSQEIFAWLLEHIPPRRVLLVGEVDCIYTADPQLTPDAERIPIITPSILAEMAHALGGSHGVDVTGGMQAKAGQALAMVERIQGLEVRILSGLTPGRLEEALTKPDAPIGTRVTA